MNHYTKGKGKIRPSSHSTSVGDILAILPSILRTPTSNLPGKDREVLAYFIIRSLKTPSLVVEEKKTKKQHDTTFSCGCFSCYSNFWVRWNFSPNEQIITQIIESFEDHLDKEETQKKYGGKSKKKTKKSTESTETTGSLNSDVTPLLSLSVMEVTEERSSLAEDIVTVESPQSDSAGDDDDGKCSGISTVPDMMKLIYSRFWNIMSPNFRASELF